MAARAAFIFLPETTQLPFTITGNLQMTKVSPENPAYAIAFPCFEEEQKYKSLLLLALRTQDQVSKCRYLPCLSLWLSSEIWAAATPARKPWDFLHGCAAQGLLRESSVDMPFRGVSRVPAASAALQPRVPPLFPAHDFSTSQTKRIPWKTLTV